MNLYFISQNVVSGYDTYSDAVVAALNEADAKNTHPDGRKEWDGKIEYYSGWSKANDVNVKLIGIAIAHLPAGVICASFNA